MIYTKYKSQNRLKEFICGPIGEEMEDIGYLVEMDNNLGIEAFGIEEISEAFSNSIESEDDVVLLNIVKERHDLKENMGYIRNRVWEMILELDESGNQPWLYFLYQRNSHYIEAVLLQVTITSSEEVSEERRGIFGCRKLCI